MIGSASRRGSVEQVIGEAVVRVALEGLSERRSYVPEVRQLQVGKLGDPQRRVVEIADFRNSPRVAGRQGLPRLSREGPGPRETRRWRAHDATAHALALRGAVRHPTAQQPARPTGSLPTSVETLATATASTSENTRGACVAPHQAGLMRHRRLFGQRTDPARRRTREAAGKNMFVLAHEFAVRLGVAYDPAKADCERLAITSDRDCPGLCLLLLAIAGSSGGAEVAEGVPALDDRKAPPATIDQANVDAIIPLLLPVPASKLASQPAARARRITSSWMRRWPASASSVSGSRANSKRRYLAQRLRQRKPDLRRCPGGAFPPRCQPVAPGSSPLVSPASFRRSRRLCRLSRASLPSARQAILALDPPIIRA